MTRVLLLAVMVVGVACGAVEPAKEERPRYDICECLNEIGAGERVPAREGEAADWVWCGSYECDGPELNNCNPEPVHLWIPARDWKPADNCRACSATPGHGVSCGAWDDDTSAPVGDSLPYRFTGSQCLGDTEACAYGGRAVLHCNEAGAWDDTLCPEGTLCQRGPSGALGCH